jgi:hypothetical protein
MAYVSSDGREAGVPVMRVEVTRGETVDFSLETDTDLTNYSADMDVRLTADTPAPIWSLASPASITMGTGATGIISWRWTAAQTAMLTAGEKAAVFDLRLTKNTGEVTVVLKGLVAVCQRVTR